MTCTACGKKFLRSALGAQISHVANPRLTESWCLPCWDNDPRAVEQYRSFIERNLAREKKEWRQGSERDQA